MVDVQIQSWIFQVTVGFFAAQQKFPQIGRSRTWQVLEGGSWEQDRMVAMAMLSRGANLLRMSGAPRPAGLTACSPLEEAAPAQRAAAGRSVDLQK